MSPTGVQQRGIGYRERCLAQSRSRFSDEGRVLGVCGIDNEHGQGVVAGVDGEEVLHISEISRAQGEHKV